MNVLPLALSTDVPENLQKHTKFHKAARQNGTVVVQ